MLQQQVDALTFLIAAHTDLKVQQAVSMTTCDSRKGRFINKNAARHAE
jgi:hypothetical protein